MLLTVSSCQSEGNVAEPLRPVEITTEISSTVTRVAYNGNKAEFAANDRIDVIGVPAGTTTLSPLPEGAIKSAYVFDGKSWAAESTMLWATDDITYDFYGIYPCMASGYVYSIQGNAAHDDVLLAKTPDISFKESGGKVNLAFSHAMAKLVVNISRLRDEIAADANISVSIDAVKGYSVDIQSQKVSPTAESPSALSLSELTARTTYETLLPEQTGISLISISDGTKTYTWQYSAGLPLTAGKVTTVTLSVGNDAAIIGSVNVTDWTSDTLEGSEVEEVEPQ